MDLFKYFLGFVLISFVSCSPDVTEIKDVQSNFMSPGESFLQAVLTLFFRIPLLRSMILESPIQPPLDPSSENSPKEVARRNVFSGIISVMREMEKSAQVTADGDFLINDLDVRKYFIPELSLKSLADIIFILISSFPQHIQDLFTYRYNRSDEDPSNEKSSTAIGIDLIVKFGEELLIQHFESVLKVTNYPKLLNLYLKRKPSPLEPMNANEYIISPELNFKNMKYVLMSKLVLISHEGREYCTTYSKNFQSGNSAAIMHDKYRGNINVFGKTDLSGLDQNSLLLIYAAVDESGKISTWFDDDPKMRMDRFLLAEFDKSVIDIEKLLLYFNNQTELNSGISLLFEKGIFYSSVVSFYFANRRHVDLELIRSVMFLSSEFIHLKGGMGYSFSPSSSGESYIPLELALSVMESDDGVVSQIFKAFTDRNTTKWTKEFAIVLFKMRIGLLNISLETLSSMLATKMRIRTVDLTGFHSSYSMTTRVFAILKKVDDIFIGKPAPKVVIYDGLDSDDVIEIQNNTRNHPISAWQVIKPRDCYIDGAWLDLSFSGFRPNRIRYIYSSPESEIFAVEINRAHPSSISNPQIFNTIVELRSQKLSVQSFIFQKSSSNDLYHIKQIPNSEEMRIFVPGGRSHGLIVPPDVFKHSLQKQSTLIFYKSNSKAQKTIEPIILGHVPEAIKTIVRNEIGEIIQKKREKQQQRQQQQEHSTVN